MIFCMILHSGLNSFFYHFPSGQVPVTFQMVQGILISQDTEEQGKWVAV